MSRPQDAARNPENTRKRASVWSACASAPLFVGRDGIETAGDGNDEDEDEDEDDEDGTPRRVMRRFARVFWPVPSKTISPPMPGHGESAISIWWIRARFGPARQIASSSSRVAS